LTISALVHTQPGDLDWAKGRIIFLCFIEIRAEHEYIYIYIYMEIYLELKNLGKYIIFIQNLVPHHLCRGYVSQSVGITWMLEKLGT
jgi:hypothetical protein